MPILNTYINSKQYWLRCHILHNIRLRIYIKQYIDILFAQNYKYGSIIKANITI